MAMGTTHHAGMLTLFSITKLCGLVDGQREPIHAAPRAAAVRRQHNDGVKTITKLRMQ
jgi:hypothetical protein